MTPLEAAVVRAIVEYVESLGGYVLNFHGSARRLGVPDLIVCVAGHFVAVEVKQPGKRATFRQRVELDRIRRAGGVAFEADSVETVQAELQALGVPGA